LDQQEKRLEREQHILTCAWKMVADRGFLALKISDLAKAASVSVGTLYAHFESKEDLIIAMSVDAWQAKLAYIERVCNLDLDAVERVVAIPIALFIFDRENPPLFEAQQLAGVPSIWRKASAQRHQSMLNLCSGFETQLMPLVEAACESGGFEATEERAAGMDAIEYSQIALAVGNAYMSNLFLPESEREELQRRQRESMPRLAMAAFKGFGMRHDDPLALYRRLVALCEGLLPRREYPDCHNGVVSRS
jgi:AcrR family transcriptional regulator